MVNTDSRAKALLIASAAAEKKGDNIVILDMQKVATFCDYFVIASAGSFKKTQAVAENIKKSLRYEQIDPDHVEGMKQGQWVLLDYGDTIAHVFHEQMRGLYDLERLWGDAERIAVNA